MQRVAQDDPPEDHRIICDGCHEVRPQTMKPRQIASQMNTVDRPFLERGINVQHAPRRLTRSAWSVCLVAWCKIAADCSKQVCFLRGALLYTSRSYALVLQTCSPS